MARIEPRIRIRILKRDSSSTAADAKGPPQHALEPRLARGPCARSVGKGEPKKINSTNSFLVYLFSQFRLFYTTPPPPSSARIALRFARCYAPLPPHPQSSTSPTSTPASSFNAKNSSLVGTGAKELAKICYSKSEEGRFPLTLGGDHSISLGSLAGVLRSRPNTGVIWVDAHADLNTPWISESGNMHGMPVGLLMEGMVPEGKSVGEIEGLNWLSEVRRRE